jgi:hypothetical protein
MMVRALPRQMRAAAGKSYLGLGFSPSMYIESTIVMRIASEQVVVNNVMSANGSIKTCPKLPTNIHINPPNHLRVRNELTLPPFLLISSDSFYPIFI